MELCSSNCTGSYKFDRMHHNGILKLREYGSIVREDIIPGVSLVLIFKPEDIETLFRCEGRFPERRSHLALQKFRLDRPDVYNSGGLLPTNGYEWWRIRKQLQKELSGVQNIAPYIPKVDEVTKQFMERRFPGRYKDFLPKLCRLYLELTILVAFDQRLGSFEESELRDDSRSSKLIKAASAINTCIMKTDNGPQLWKKMNTPLYNKLAKSHLYLELAAKEFIKRRTELSADAVKNTNSCLVDHYFDNSELDMKDIVGFMTDMLLAGIDTMTYTTCFALYHLATNRNVQDRMFEELKYLLPLGVDLITKNSLDDAQYTKAVIKEVFRMNPISIGIGRVLQKDASFSNFEVPSGTVVVTQNQVSCRLPEYFKDCDEFIPERWIKGSSEYESVHPYLVLPFGHGPRTCIARRLAHQNLQIFLMNVVRQFELIWNGKSLDSKSLLINKPDKPIAITFISRNQK